MGSTSRTSIRSNRYFKNASCSALLVFLLAGPLFSTERFELKRKDGSLLIGYFDQPKEASFPITLIVPGSQKESASRLHTSLKEDLLSAHQCPVTLEKRGLLEESLDEKEFIQALTHEERLDDHFLFVAKLKEGLIAGWNGKLAIIGQGDGGRIGASLATKMENIKGLVLIAAGGAWTPQEEALYSFRSEMADEGYSPQYIHGFLTQAKQQFSQAAEMPKTEHKAFGYTYKYWASLLKTNLFQDLRNLQCPIYSINGAKDARVPIESVEVLAKQLKEKLTLNRKENVGREIIQDKKTYEEAISWLQNL